MKQSLPRNGGPSPKKVLKADVWVCDTEEVRDQMVSQLDG